MWLDCIISRQTRCILKCKYNYNNKYFRSDNPSSFIYDVFFPLLFKIISFHSTLIKDIWTESLCLMLKLNLFGPTQFLGTLTSNFRYVLKYRFINKSVVRCPRPVIFMATRKLRTSNQPRQGGGEGGQYWHYHLWILSILPRQVAVDILLFHDSRSE